MWLLEQQKEKTKKKNISAMASLMVDVLEET